MTVIYRSARLLLSFATATAIALLGLQLLQPGKLAQFSIPLSLQRQTQVILSVVGTKTAYLEQRIQKFRAIFQNRTGIPLPAVPYPLTQPSDPGTPGTVFCQGRLVDGRPTEARRVCYILSCTPLTPWFDRGPRDYYYVYSASAPLVALGREVVDPDRDSWHQGFWQWRVRRQGVDGGQPIRIDLNGSSANASIQTADGSIQFRTEVLPDVLGSGFTGRLHMVSSLVVFILGLYTVIFIAIGRIPERRLDRCCRELIEEATSRAPCESRERNIIRQLKDLCPSVGALAEGSSILANHVPRPMAKGAFKGMQGLLLAPRQVAVLFVDIKDFTTLSESLPPYSLSILLENYFRICVRSIREMGGDVDKFIGDAVMGIWITDRPAQLSLIARAAAFAALLLRTRLREFTPRLAELGLPPIVCRVGVHAGETLAGMTGCRERRSYTVLGDVVNTASRLEGANKSFGTHVLVSAQVAQTFSHFERAIVQRRLGEVTVKGKSLSVPVVALYDGWATCISVDCGREPLQIEEELALCSNVAGLHEAGLKAFNSGLWHQATEICADILTAAPGDTAASELLSASRGNSLTQTLLQTRSMTDRPLRAFLELLFAQNEPVTAKQLDEFVWRGGQKYEQKLVQDASAVLEPLGFTLKRISPHSFQIFAKPSLLSDTARAALEQLQARAKAAAQVHLPNAQALQRAANAKRDWEAVEALLTATNAYKSELGISIGQFLSTQQEQGTTLRGVLSFLICVSLGCGGSLNQDNVRVLAQHIVPPALSTDTTAEERMKGWTQQLDVLVRWGYFRSTTSPDTWTPTKELVEAADRQCLLESLQRGNTGSFKEEQLDSIIASLPSAQIQVNSKKQPEK